jgi:CDP-diacylglycerol--serine O-phosphatidyltransferase
MLMFCFLLIAELPLFALKFKDFTWQNNRVKFIFLIGILLILPLFLDAQTGIDPTAIAIIILWYIALSMVAWKLKWT